MNIDTLTIGDAKALAGMFNGAAAPKAAISHGLQIVILDRGFVYVGDTTTDGEWCVVTNARNVRRWGTTKGLGELAAEGPKSNTVLDPAGTIRAPMRAVIGLIACEAAKWTR